MTAKELIAILESLPPDARMMRSGGGDYGGYLDLCSPMAIRAWPNPLESHWYTPPFEGCPHNPPDYPARIDKRVQESDVFDAYSF